MRIDDNGNKSLAHTLNGSSLPLPRIVACLLENFQTESSIKIPKVLVNYTGFEEIQPFCKTKKKLGQHFLKSSDVAKKIVDCLNTNNICSILEVGPEWAFLQNI